MDIQINLNNKNRHKDMKMFKYIIGSGAFMLLASIIGTACTDGNDWDVDSAHDRLFSVTASKNFYFCTTDIC